MNKLDFINIFQFIQKQIDKYGIDESHGMKHAKGTFVRAHQIIKTIPDISEEEKYIALYCAALHDMCDSKYTDVEVASEEIRLFLISEGLLADFADAVIKIITTMSYSKLNSRKKSAPTVSTASIFPDHGKWQRAYHIARHADLLEGYVVARCVLYSKHICPEKPVDEHWRMAEDLFVKRIYLYISEGWITIPSAIEIAAELEKEAQRCFHEKMMHWPELIIDF
jgi:hypothetical protein